jgi:hypothetical protein
MPFRGANLIGWQPLPADRSAREGSIRIAGAPKW